MEATREEGSVGQSYVFSQPAQEEKRSNWGTQYGTVGLGSPDYKFTNQQVAKCSKIHYNVCSFCG